MDQAYSEPVGQPWQYSKEYHQISDFLGVNIYDRNDADLHKKVSALQEWGGGEDLHKVLTQIAKLRKELGVQFIGKSLVKELYQSVRLKQDGERMNPPESFVKPKTEEKPSQALGVIEKAIQKVVTQTIKQTLKNSVKEVAK